MLGPANEPWLNHCLAALVSLPLLLRRRFPEAVAGVALVAAVTQMSSFVCPFAFYAVGAYRGTRHRAVVWGSAVVGFLALAPWTQPGFGLRDLVTWVLLRYVLQVLLPLVIGLYADARRAMLAALVERAERAEREQSLIAEAARVEERTRIAGEMHDVVSHQVSLMVVHANALEVVAHDPEVTREAAVTIRTAGRQALDELREMIGVLRRGPDEDARPADGDGRTGEGTPDGKDGTGDGDSGDGGQRTARRPRPGLEQIPALVDASRAAGLKAVLRVEGEPRALPDAAERAAYRVVQEALTNVHKHAAGADTEVRLAHGAEALHVSVVNARPGRSAPRPGSSPGAEEEPLLPSGGHGLIGLGERVRLVGGTIETGPRPDGGFRVAITLPAPAAAQDPAASAEAPRAEDGPPPDGPRHDPDSGSDGGPRDG
ncbi:two-component sensor histidine kinase [Streptomyces daliensis]|uniref:histidine kinase n=1 Tax=Streptomyces daliensis TaxID=299421 RepID=A0A8T4IZD4_9ACTN|nr:two-component sensor histidine kinase [Streptomyces daliensis]